MLYDMGISWRNMRAHPVQSFIPALIVGLALALSITVLVLSDGVRRGIIRASDPFGVLVVGAKGDGQQLVLSSILLQGAPVGVIPHELYEEFENDPRVRLAVPIAQADSVSGAPIIGTNANFFELRTDVGAVPAFRLTDGELFDDHFEAVLGSVAANALGLSVGDTFRTAHGTGNTLDRDTHEQIYAVVGVLQPSRTPFDSAVFTSLDSIWDVHAEQADGENRTDGEDHAEGDLTAILVAPVGFVEQNQIWRDFYIRTDAQAAFPGQELAGLFDLMRQGERILTIIGYLVLGIAGLTVFLSMYNVTLTRQQEIAVMRSLGGSRVSIFRMVIFETLAITLLGALLGRVIGYGAAATIAGAFASQSAIPVDIRYLFNLEPVLWALALGVGVLAGLLPALSAYQVNVVERLFPT